VIYLRGRALPRAHCLIHSRHGQLGSDDAASRWHWFVTWRRTIGRDVENGRTPEKPWPERRVKEGKRLPMSEHEESEDELTCWMTDLPSMNLWVNELQSRVRRMLDPENPLEPERKFQELVNMARGLIFLSRRLLELATIANRAADSMTESTREANGNEQRGQDS
jgi:hypothetical protein